MEGIKILLLTNIPTPYRIPLFNELGFQLNALGFKLIVAFGSSGYKRRDWDIDYSKFQFEYCFLDSKKIKFRNSEKIIFTYSGLWKLIKREHPKAIITNAFSIATMKVWIRSFITKTRYLIWSGEILKRKVPRYRKYLRILFCRRAEAFISYGRLAREYLLSLGVVPEKIEIAINTVDTDFFKKETEKIRSRAAGKTIPKHLLCVSYLSERKQVDLLLLAAAKLLKNQNDFVLDIVGNGPQLPFLKLLAERLGVLSHVNFAGFKQMNELPEYFARSCCFLFPTKFDIWGLTLNEAMAAGIPCLASKHAGAVYDLIQDGETGFSIDFENIDDVANKIKFIIDTPKESEIIGERAKKYIENCASLTESAQGFVLAIMKSQNN